MNRWLSLLNDHERSLLGVVVGVVHQERVGMYNVHSYYRTLASRTNELTMMIVYVRRSRTWNIPIKQMISR